MWELEEKKECYKILCSENDMAILSMNSQYLSFPAEDIQQNSNIHKVDILQAHPLVNIYQQLIVLEDRDKPSFSRIGQWLDSHALVDGLHPKQCTELS